MSPPNEELRFKIGDRVECYYARFKKFEWTSGTVDELWYRETDWSSDEFAPYSIKLDCGRMIYAPFDTDQHIRAETDISTEEARLQSNYLATTSAPEKRKTRRH